MVLHNWLKQFVKPVTLKSSQFVPTLYWVQYIVILNIFVFIFFAFHTSLLFLFFVPFFFYLLINNNKKIQYLVSIELMMNTDCLWRIIDQKKVTDCELIDYWSGTSWVFIALKNQSVVHHFILLRSKIGAEEFTRLKLGVLKNEQQLTDI